MRVIRKAAINRDRGVAASPNSGTAKIVRGMMEAVLQYVY